MGLPFNDPRELAKVPQRLADLSRIGRFDGVGGEFMRLAHFGSHLGQSDQRGTRLLWQVDFLRAVEQPLDRAVEFRPSDEGERSEILNRRLLYT